MKLKKGDQVKIMRGRDRGKTGVILRVLKDSDRIVVEGANLVNKRTRPKQQGKKGETVAVPASMSVSSAMLVCKNCKEPARLGMKIEGDKKMRYCKKCGAPN